MPLLQLCYKSNYFDMFKQYFKVSSSPFLKKKKKPQARWVSRRMKVPWQPAFSVYRDGVELKAMAVLHS